MDSDSNSVDSSVYSLPRSAEQNTNPYTYPRIPSARVNNNQEERYSTPNIKDFNMDFDGPDVDLHELAQHHLNDNNEYDNVTLINNLPPEVLLLIFSQISHKPHLVPLLSVCKKWGDLVVELLWFRPTLMDKKAVAGIKEVMAIDRTKTYWDYRRYIRRLNLSFVVQRINDEFLHLFAGCNNLERLTLVNCSNLTHSPIVGILQNCTKLQSVDMTGVKDITDDIFNALAENSPRLQGLYAPQCPQITNDAFMNIVRNCPMLKRVKVSDCENINDDSIFELVDKCRSLIEVDVHNCTEITDASLLKLFTDLEQLREFRISQNTNISDNICRNIPETMMFDRLRIVDFTACVRITDRTVERIVMAAPRLRNVILSKCLSITDASLRALSTLNKNLHYIHLGHCSNITDDGVRILIDKCRRLQYIDLACCSQLTNRSVIALKDLPRLRRIGLVKCSNISDQGIFGMLHGRGQNDTLERVHLSYCTNLTLAPIVQLLHFCPRLTHLSLTGIDCFLTPEITAFCREAPPDFNEHQKRLFCVFSGQGVKKLRDYFNKQERPFYNNGDLLPPLQLGDERGVDFLPANRRILQFREALNFQQHLQQLQQFQQFQQQQQQQQRFPIVDGQERPLQLGPPLPELAQPQPQFQPQQAQIQQILLPGLQNDNRFVNPNAAAIDDDDDDVMDESE